MEDKLRSGHAKMPFLALPLRVARLVRSGPVRHPFGTVLLAVPAVAPTSSTPNRPRKERRMRDHFLAEIRLRNVSHSSSRTDSLRTRRTKSRDLIFHGGPLESLLLGFRQVARDRFAFLFAGLVDAHSFPVPGAVGFHARPAVYGAVVADLAPATLLAEAAQSLAKLPLALARQAGPVRGVFCS